MQYADYTKILNTGNLISFWTFNEDAGNPRKSLGMENYPLIEGNGPVKRVKDGIFGQYSALIEEGQWFYIPRAKCSRLNIYGKNAQVTIIAWVKRGFKSFDMCEAIAGIWNETKRKRQYCLFLNLSIWDSSEQVCGHISGIGGPTEGYKYCMDASIGKTRIGYQQWHCVAITYDSSRIKSYLDGILDKRPGLNPYSYDKGIYDGGEDGGDFTVGAVHRSNEMGNFFVGQIGGLAVFDRALTDEEIGNICSMIDIP